MKRMLMIILAAVIALVGCQGFNTKNTTTKDGTRTENTTYEQTRYNDKNVTHNERFREMSNREDRLNRQNDRNRDNYSVSREAADKITSEIDEIDQAYVITTRNNAYVAATLNENSDRDRDTNNTNIDRTRSGSDNRDGTRNNRTDKNNTRNDSTGNNTRNNVGINNDSSFRDGDELTDEVKKQISDIVQSVDNNIDNVFVTTSPDFVNLSEQYANDVEDGRPIRGFFDQIGNAIERLFPQDKSEGNHTR